MGRPDVRLVPAALATLLRQLEAAQRSGGKPETIDWFAMGDAWARARDDHAMKPVGSSESVAQEVAALLRAG